MPEHLEISNVLGHKLDVRLCLIFLKMMDTSFHRKLNGTESQRTPKLLELLDTQGSGGPFNGSCWRCLGILHLRVQRFPKKHNSGYFPLNPACSKTGSLQWFMK